MSNAFLILEARLYAILVEARGADGALGGDALAKSIPLGRFRRAEDGAPLRDPSYPPEAFDRAVSVEWLSDADDPAINNPLDGPQHREARVTVLNGVLFGTALSAFLSLAGSEVAGTVALQPRTRALNDSMRIQRALACPDLLRGGAAIDPVPLACVREGGTALEMFDDGRAIVTTTYALRYQVDNDGAYDP